MNITYYTLFHNLYETFIRPHLEHSFQAWRPFLRKDITLLEDVQRRSTKLVKGLQDIEYVERAHLLNPNLLSCRMDNGDLILVLKILIGFLEGVQWQDFFRMADTSRRRGHPLKLWKDRSKLDLRKYTFNQRVVNMWNDLPAEVVTYFIREDDQKQARGLPEKPP